MKTIKFDGNYTKVFGQTTATLAFISTLACDDILRGDESYQPL